MTFFWGRGHSSKKNRRKFEIIGIREFWDFSLFFKTVPVPTNILQKRKTVMW